MRYLGIDYGHRKIGLAISDEEGSFSFPYQVIKNDSSARSVATIKNICLVEKIEKIIIGQSLDLSGQANPIQEAISKFKEKLEKEIGLMVEFQTEHFTTREARRLMADQENDSLVDARAAALILKSYLETHSAGK